MTKNKYPLYGVVIVAAAGVAFWAGLPPSLLILLLVCPLMMLAMMFFMMRGRPVGQESHDGPAQTRDLGAAHRYDR